MASLIHFSLRAIALLLIVIVGFSVMKPFISCDGKTAYQCFSFKLNAVLPHGK